MGVSTREKLDPDVPSVSISDSYSSGRTLQCLLLGALPLLLIAIQAIANIGEVVWVGEMLNITIATIHKPSSRFGIGVNVLHCCMKECYSVLQCVTVIYCYDVAVLQ